MKSTQRIPLTSLLLVFVLAILNGAIHSHSRTEDGNSENRSSQDRTAGDPAGSGHWKGAIVLPGTELEILVDLERNPVWSGSIDIPVQGLRGFKLGNVSIEDEKVSFTMPNIPGDPKFTGLLEGDSIRGDFTQSGQSFKFHLTRTGDKSERKGATPARGQPGEGYDGAWQGSLMVNGFEMRLLFKLQTEGPEVTGTMSSIDQNANDIPISGGTADKKNLRIEIQVIGGVFEGKMNDDGSAVDGEWRQGRNSFPLKIVRLDHAPDLSRPQDPKKPYPYIEEQIVFANPRASVELAGTLTYPETGGPHPVVVLISGSGPQDRDEAIMGHRPFLVLADHLTRRGIAVLRFDDRGTGKSTGDFSQALTTDFADDVLAAVEYIKTRSQLDSRRIGLVGHSEGGLIAPMVSAQSKDVAFLVLLAGVGVPMDQLLYRQSADMLKVMGATAEIIEEQNATQRRIFEIVLKETDSNQMKQRVRDILEEHMSELSPEQMKAMGISKAHVESQVQMVSSPWFRNLLSIDPGVFLRKVQVPLLAINGKKDVQVAYQENLDAIHSALNEGGNSQVTTKAFDDLNHLFQKCKTGATSEYGTIDETFNPAALNAVSTWIRKTCGMQ